MHAISNDHCSLLTFITLHNPYVSKKLHPNAAHAPYISYKVMRM